MLAHVGLPVIVVAFACGGAPSARQVDKPAPSITLLDAGAEPRRQLHYQPRLHVPERLETRLEIAMETAFTNTVLETGRQRVDLPTVRIAGRVEVTSFTPEGDAVVTCEVEGGAVLDDVVDPAVRRPLEAEIAKMKGWRGSWRLSPSGRTSQVAADASSRSIRSLSESVRSASVVFPDAAIGIGATWQVRSRLSEGGVTWDRTVMYRLRELAGSTATVDADLVMRAPSQALSVEPNESVRLTAGTSNASAELIVPLHGLVTATQSLGTSEMKYSEVWGRLRITRTVQAETQFSVKPLGAAEPGDGSVTGLPTAEP
jgi:hypothetical protein